MMNIRQWFGVLMGNRRAIEAWARSRGTLWLGALFVVSAALAREYDGVDLVHAPWHLAIPFVASVVSSWLLFIVLWGVAWRRGADCRDFLARYRQFLSLYWATAPLAWLYGIPFERIMNDVNATRFNLIMLGIVALWRVVLMIRVVQVMLGASWLSAVWSVMLFADALTLAVVVTAPVPVVQMMGGVRLTDVENLVQGTAVVVGLAAFLSSVLWASGFLSILLFVQRRWQWQWPVEASDDRVPRALWGLGIASILFWLAWLPLTQPPQWRRMRAEWLLRHGDLDEAVTYLSRHEPADFPPGWDPPPRYAHGDRQPAILDVLEAVLRQPTSDWVTDVYLDKFVRYRYGVGWDLLTDSMDEQQVNRLLDILDKTESRHALLGTNRDLAESLHRAAARLPSTHDRIQDLLARAGTADLSGQLDATSRHAQERHDNRPIRDGESPNE